MNEISKLYENAGIEKPCTRPKDLICATFRPDGLYRCTNGCYNCIYLGECPPFIAEKQLSLTHKMWQILPNVYPNFDLLVDHSYGEMIATFVNSHWQDLSEEEHKQIKEILK